MKKNKFLVFLLFTLFPLIFFSCQEEIDSTAKVDDNGINKVETKSISTDEMNNIDQFLNEPFYIRKVGQSSNDESYLSFNPQSYVDKSSGRASTWHDLRLEKLTSERQQWIFTKISPAPGYKFGYFYRIKNVSSEMEISRIGNNPALDATPARGGGYNFGRFFDLEFIPETNLFKIGIYTSSGRGTTNPQVTEYLTSKNTYNGELTYSTAENQSRQTWQIIPCDEFEVIEYSFTIANGFDRIKNVPKIWSTTLENNKNEVTNREYNIKHSTETTSTFSTTKGVKTTKTIGMSAKIGVPAIVKVADVTLSTEITREDSYSYQEGVQDKRIIEISEKISFIQQPWQTVKIETISSEYDTSVTYIAKIRGLSSGKIFYLTGKWDGVIVGDTYIKVTDISKGTIIAQKTINR